MQNGVRVQVETVFKCIFCNFTQGTLKYIWIITAKLETKAHSDQKLPGFGTIITNMTENCTFYAILTKNII